MYLTGDKESQENIFEFVVEEPTELQVTYMENYTKPIIAVLALAAIPIAAAAALRYNQVRKQKSIQTKKGN